MRWPATGKLSGVGSARIRSKTAIAANNPRLLVSHPDCAGRNGACINGWCLICDRHGFLPR